MKFISTQGYKRNSPDVNRPLNVIPSGRITMQDVDFPVRGVDNLGNEMFMVPGGEYYFPGDYVVETPMMQRGGLTFQQYYTPAAESTGANYTPTMTVQAAEKLKAQRDAQELARRKQAIQASQAAASKPLGKRLTPENLAQETGATGDKLRFFPNDPDSFIDEYLNPLKMIGDMASGLGRMPLNISQGNYGQAAMSVATPLVVGATAGLGAKSAGQFVNNLANPLAGTGQFLTTKTPLKNAYNLLPEGSFSGYSKLRNADKSYRVAGMDAYDDFVESGVLRSNAPNPPAGASLEERVMLSRPTGFPSFQKGFADLRYLPDNGGVVFETSLPTFKRGEINPVTGQRIKGRHYAHRVIDPNTGATMSNIPGENISVYEGAPHWLKGYRQIDTPKQLPGAGNTFKSEIDWAKWNLDTPKYPELIDEYNAIEESTKKAGTWMKNPDGSPFQGTPEQFIQQQSSWFKKAFGESKLIGPEGSPMFLYHGSAKKFDTFDPSKFQLGDAGYSGAGVYTTPSKTTANSYATSSAKFHSGDIEPTVYELYGQGNRPIKSSDLIKENQGRDLFNFYRDRNWKGELSPYESLREYDVAISDQLPNVQNIRPLHDAREIVFPKNTQLKSAVGNVGFFDMSNPNIYKAAAPISIGLGTTTTQEYQKGGQHGGLDRWFAEKWVDIKTGKECGRQEGEKRAGYPACRPSKRISEDTPKTASELSSSEKEKFKRSKTSSERISYQHKRKQDGGEWLDKYDEGGAIYTVKKGDTLSKIAAENKTTVNKIVQANNIKNPNIIGIDQKLVIPQSSSINNAQTGSTQYVDWSEKKKNLDRLNSLPDEQLITGFYSDKPEQTYLVVDKKNAQMKVYKGDKVVKTYEVGVGANPGDAQTVTKMVNGKTDWGAGNRSTGAGVYTISNIDPASKAYYGLPSFNLKNDRGIEVATTIHGTPIGRRSRFDNDNVEDNRMSYGCINGKCFDLKDLQQHVDIETPVYILPEDEGNRFQIVDGKPVLKVSAQNRNKYNNYIDARGNVQKGQGANQSVNTLSYKPIQAVFDENKFKEKVFTWNDLNDKKEYEQTTKPFYKALVKNKQSIMKTAKIPSDVYNELAQMAFGIYGTESNFGDTHSAAGNLARAAVKFLDSKNSSSPDYTSKATTYGANEDFRSVGLTQVRWNYLNEDEKRVLKSLGITSNMDFMDPEKAAIGTVALLGVRYNQQLTSDQKRDVWAHLPSKWNRRKNYGDRVKQNASYLNFKEATDKRQTGGQTNWLDNYTD